MTAAHKDPAADSTSLLGVMSDVIGVLPPALKHPNKPPVLLLSESTTLDAVRALAGNTKHMTRQMMLKAAPTPLQTAQTVTNTPKMCQHTS